MKLLLLSAILLAGAANASSSPYCGSENFASPECRGVPAYQKGRGTRNADYRYCDLSSDSWAVGYFHCLRADGRKVRLPVPRYKPNCDGSEAFGSADWWACRDK